MIGPSDRELSYCARELRRRDHDRFLTGLFAPADRREDLYALYAFNLEVARVAETVSEPMLGRIRLQWWREAIDELYAGRLRRHQVIEPLAAAVERHDLDRDRFERLLEAREFDLDGEAPASLEALEGYVEATSSDLIVLALEVLGAGDEPAALEAGRLVGLAWALTGLARAVPFHAAQKRCYLPADLCREAGLELGDLFERRGSPALCRVVERLVARAEQHLAAARRLRRRVPRDALAALLPARLADGYLAALRRAGCDPFRLPAQAGRGGRPWRLLLSSTLGHY
ncbi:MAG: phytoene/squalene synthase family protein [Kiloniellales bacterium]